MPPATRSSLPAEGTQTCCLDSLTGVFFFFFLLHWVFIAACGFSLVAISRGYSSLCCNTSLGRGFSCCGARALEYKHRLRQLWLTGSVAQWYVGSSWTREIPGSWDLPGSHISHIGRQILNHWTTRKVQLSFFLVHSALCSKNTLSLFFGCSGS